METGATRRGLAWMGRLHWWHWTLMALGVLCLTVAVVRQPLTRYATRRALARIPGWTGTVAAARVSFFPLVYTVTDLTLVPEDRSLPVFYVGRLDSGLFWGDLLRGRLNAWGKLDRAKMTFFLIPIVIPDIAALLQKILPLAIERLQLKRGEITIALRKSRSDDPERPEGTGPQIWFHDMEASMEGLATRTELEKHATTLAIRATMAHSGTFQAFVTADLLATDMLSFTGQFELRGLQLSDLDTILRPAGLQIRGTFDQLARFGVERGKLTGALQPLLKNGHVEAVGGDLGNKLKASLADDGVEMLSDGVPGRNAVSTIIPIHGTLMKPKIDVWTAVSGVMRNAFVEGLSESLQRLPAPAAAPGTAPAAGAPR